VGSENQVLEGTLPKSDKPEDTFLQKAKSPGTIRIYHWHGHYDRIVSLQIACYYHAHSSMHCLHVRACFAIFFGIFAASSLAGETDGDLTADELAVKAASLYANGNYEKAAELYRKFVTDFGSAADAQEAIRQMRYPLAMCLVRLQRFAEALAAIENALGSDPPIETAQMQELLFWKGVCEIQQEQGEAARKTLEGFLAVFPSGSERNSGYARQFPAVLKVPEARLLLGTCLLLEGRLSDAADYYARTKAELAPINRGRATILQLHALLEASMDDEAMRLIREEFPRMGELLQLVTFQTLTFELGTRYLEGNKPRDAIICLQRVWSAGRLLKHQDARLEDLESKLQAAEAGPRGDAYARLFYGQMIAKVKREIENFRKIENFDAAVRLRLAAAYQAMHRYRESALILEGMVDELPADRIVESASANLVQCWSAIECWPKVIEAAGTFAKRFPKSSQLPLICYLQGIAEQRRSRYREAVAIFEAICKEYPSSDYAPRARFMGAFSLLQADKNKQAIAEFERFEEQYPRHDLRQDAMYWRAIGWSFERQFERCREVMDDYLGTYNSGRYRASAVFRKAYCAQQLRDFQTSVRELKAFLSDHPTAQECNEARILLGDALMSQGRMEEGIVALRSLSKADTRLYAEGVFKIGKAYKLMEEYEKLRDHMANFRAENPNSPRVAEAIFWMGWTYRLQGSPDAARDLYWSAISEYGDDATIQSVEDLFPAVSKLYKGDDEQAEYCSRLARLRWDAERAGRKTLATRAIWGEAVALRRRDAARAQAGLVEVSKRLNVQTDNPLIIADCADALLSAGMEEEAEDLYRDLVKWNPRAPQKDRALAAMGRIEMKRGNAKAALERFERFEREVVGSQLFGEVMLSRAQILQASGRVADARKDLEKLLASEYSIGKEKAEALYLIGETYMSESRPDLAVPYFQRLYVMYGRWRDWVAKAYYRSGEAFEKLNDELSARRTYQELIEREDLAGFEEALKARRRLDSIGGPFPTGPTGSAEG
jgi:TolA-binding protein